MGRPIPNEEPWRDNDGTPQHGLVEYVDRAMRTGIKPGSSLSWKLIGHSDDVVRWRPAAPGAMMGYARRPRP